LLRTVVVGNEKPVDEITVMVLAAGDPGSMVQRCLAALSEQVLAR